MKPRPRWAGQKESGMDQVEMTEQQRMMATECIARVVEGAATPDRAGERLSGGELTKLAEDVAGAILAGVKKLSGGG